MKAYTHLLVHELRELERLTAGQIARRLGIPLRTVQRHLAQDRQPIVASRPAHESILDPYKARAEALQREGLTGVQTLVRLREAGYRGSRTILMEHLRQVRPAAREAFLTLKFEPGQMAEIDFAECGLVRVGGIRRKLYAFVMTLGYSRRVFVKFIMRMDMAHFLSCQREAWEYFGGVPREVMVDNCKVAVLHHPGGIYGPAQLNPRYADFAAYYGFTVKPCTVRRPNEKGAVERSVGYLRTSLLNGLDTGERSLLAVNEAGRRWQEEVADRRRLRDGRGTPLELFQAEAAALRPLPPLPYDCSVRGAVVSTVQCRVSFEGNRYSTPPSCAGVRLELAALPDSIRLFRDGEVVAEHVRCYERGREIVAYAHDCELLKRRKKSTRAMTAERFLALCPQAEAYLAELRRRRLDADVQLARIMALTTVYGDAAVAEAVKESMRMEAYGSEYVNNLLAWRRQLAPAPSPLHVPGREDILELEIRQPDLDIYSQRTKP
jgi:transposase